MHEFNHIITCCVYSLEHVVKVRTFVIRIIIYFKIRENTKEYFKSAPISVY